MTPDTDKWYWNPEYIVRVQELFGPSFEIPFRIVTLLGDSGLILIGVAATFWLFGRRIAYGVLATVMIGAVLGSAIKVFTDIARPEHADLIAYEIGSSPTFPSGHTFLAISFWGALVFLGVLRTAVAAVIVVLVMMSRVFLGVHYLADMIVGVALGLLAVTLGYAAVRLILDRLSEQQAAMLMAAGLFGSLIMLPVTGDFPLGWEILGGLLGAGIGTLVESRRIRYTPATLTAQSSLIRLAIGGGGIVLFVIAGSLTRDLGAPVLFRIGLFFIAGVWAMYLAPLLLDRLGHNQNADESAFRASNVART